MNGGDCLRVLGLGDTASVSQIKRAYRRHAQKLHPDKNNDDPVARRRFIEVSQAYRSLMTAARTVRTGRIAGTCTSCVEFGEVARSPDGRLRCGRCALTPRGGRLLPLPTIVVVRCFAAMAFMGTGVYFLLTLLATGQPIYAVYGALAGLAGLAALAWTCLRVIHCIRPSERRWTPSRRAGSNR